MTTRSAWSAAALAIGTCASLAAGARAQSLQATLVASGVNKPIFVCAASSDPARLFVVGQGGVIRVIENGVLLPAPFADLSPSGLNRTSLNGYDRGMRGMAFHPNYAHNGHVFFSYTAAANGSSVIERFTRGATDPVAIDPSSGVVILGPIAQPQADHNGGCIQFGNDGKLYVAMGDGGSTIGGPTPPYLNSRSGSTLLGKMLRLDVDIAFPHVPSDNPYFGAGPPLDEIWHFGLRHPWRFCVDRATGDIYIGDSGLDTLEEIDFQPAGESGLDYGWPCMEGSAPTGFATCAGADVATTPPIGEYLQGTTYSAVIGGCVYRGCAIPSLAGTYFYADYASSTIWSFQYTGGQVTNHVDRTAELEPAGTPTIHSISSFGEDALGEIYVCDYFDGEIYRIDAAGTPADCNANGVPDGCDIASGTSRDTNANGVPDECDCQPAPFIYCTAKFNSLLCSPAIGFAGVPSIGGTQFDITATNVLSNKTGLLFYGYGSAAAPFQGGVMCVASPRTRTPSQNSGGTPGGGDCTGTFTFDMLGHVLSGADPQLLVGQQVNCQYWSRDPQDAFTTNTTDAVEFVICN
jgi:hypothetical protein